MTDWPRHIELGDKRLYVDVTGAGEPVLLLHGMALDQRMWSPQVDPLSRHYRVVRLDLLGFGKSSPVAGPYSHGELVAELLARLDIEQAHVVGHSMGGRIAAEFVQSHPRAAASLTLVAADIAGLPFTTLGPAFRRIFQTAAHDLPAAKRLFLELDSFAVLRDMPAPLAAFEAMLDDYSGWLFQNVQANPEQRPTPATAELLSSFDLPLLALVGERDAVDFHDIAAEVVRRVPGARRSVISGAGHMPNLERPEAFNDALLGFLQSVDRT